MCSSIPACLVLLGSSPVLLCLSLARLWQGAASHSHFHSLPSLCKPPPQSQWGWSRFPCCGCTEEHGRRERSSPHLTSPHPGASTTTGNPCWDGLSLWRAQGSPGEQGPGGQAEHPGILSTSPALPAAHTPQERQECRGEDPHSSTAPQNSSSPKFPRAS